MHGGAPERGVACCMHYVCTRVTEGRGSTAGAEGLGDPLFPDGSRTRKMLQTMLLIGAKNLLMPSQCGKEVAGPSTHTRRVLFQYPQFTIV